jgi:ribonuclease HIII
MAADSKSSCFVRSLDPASQARLKSALEARLWSFSTPEHSVFKAVKDGVNVVLYKSGKLVAQGAGVKDFVEFVLEPEVLGELAFADMEAASVEKKAREPFAPHAGMDESGKGDFFGPLVVSAAFVPDETCARNLVSIGVRDCKEIKNDAVLRRIADDARRVLEGRYSIVAIGPESYNRFYAKIGSLNRLLAWGHAKALENLLEKAPNCPAALADKFGDERLILNALGARGRDIRLVQRTKAESDIAVAAASILARAEFLRRLSSLGEENGVKLPKGAGTPVDKVARSLAAQGGSELLSKVGKMHFRTSYRALGIPEPPRKEWRH